MNVMHVESATPPLHCYAMLLLRILLSLQKVVTFSSVEHVPLCAEMLHLTTLLVG